MKMLAFDTSTDCLTAGIYQDTQALAEYHEVSFTRHSEGFFGVLKTLMERSKTKPAALDFVALGIGPGSFTGLRVGVAAAKMMALSLGVKLIGIPTHEIVAMNAQDYKGTVVVVGDAKKGNLYASSYRASAAGMTATQSACVVSAAEFFVKMPKPFCLIVDDWQLVRNLIPAAAQDLVAAVLERQLAFPSAAMIARAAASRITRRSFINPYKIAPLYLYPRDCNVVLKKSKGVR